MKYAIQFQSPEAIVDFVELANRFEGEIDLKRGVQIVDAKSLMGVLTIGVRDRVEMQIHGNPTRELLDAIGHVAQVKEINA